MSPISSISTTPLTQAAPIGNAGSGETGVFQSMLENMIGKVEDSHNQAQQAAQTFLNGGDEELHSVALAAQRADLQFNLFLQVRNKAVSAYQEVMKMQV